MTSTADKDRRNAYTRAEARKKVADSVGGERIEYRLTEDGETFYLPHPYFYDNATKRALKNADDDDESAQSRILLGDEQYDRFVAAGGTDEDINIVMIAIGQDMERTRGN